MVVSSLLCLSFVSLAWMLQRTIDVEYGLGQVFVNLHGPPGQQMFYGERKMGRCFGDSIYRQRDAHRED